MDTSQGGGRTDILRHMHIGTGKLGLSLPVFVGAQAGLQVTLVGRKTSPVFQALRTKRRYRVLYTDTARPAEVAVHDVLAISDPADRQKIIRSLADPATRLLTTAVGEGQLSQLAPIIAEGTKRRSPSAPRLFVAACENGLHCSSRLHQEVLRLQPVSSAEGPGVLYIDCTVDQIAPVTPYVGNDGTPCVEAESYREWVVGSTEIDLVNLLKAPREVIFVPPPMTLFYEKRKLFLVTGYQLALAAHGYWTTGRYPPLRDVLKMEDFARGVGAELGLALRLFAEQAAQEQGLVNPFTEAEIADYMRKVDERISACDDDCGRLLKDLMTDEEKLSRLTHALLEGLGRDHTVTAAIRETLQSAVTKFLTKLGERLNEPLRILVTSGRECPNLLYTMLNIISLVIEQQKLLVTTERAEQFA